MTRQAILSRLSAIFGEILGNPGLALEESHTAAHVPGWDSLNHISFVLGIEREFGIRLKAAEVAKLQDVGQMIDVILQRVSPA